MYDFSLKKRKYASQTREETYSDLPRLRTVSTIEGKQGKMEPKNVRLLVDIVKEHDRVPGTFNYDYPQNFYSLYPEIDQEAYIVLGSNQSRKVYDK